MIKTVGELIEELKRFSPETEIAMAHGDNRLYKVDNVECIILSTAVVVIT